MLLIEELIAYTVILKAITGNAMKNILLPINTHNLVPLYCVGAISCGIVG
jgi:hypothetical protein